MSSQLRIAVIWLFAVAGLAVQARGDDALEQLNLASGYFNMNRFEFAAGEYEKFLQNHPQHPKVPEALFFLGESYFQIGRLEQARSSFRRVAEGHHGSRHAPYALYRVGETSFLVDDYKAAESVLAEFIAQRPEDPLLDRALSYLGRAQLRSGKLDEARATLEEALAKFPNSQLSSRTRYDLARTFEQLGQRGAALALYRRVAGDTSSELADDAGLALGVSLFQDKAYERAAQAFGELEQQFPESPLVSTARMNRGLCLYRMGQYDLAEPVFEVEASSSGHQVPDAWYWLGLTRKAQGDHTAALQALLEGYRRFRTGPLAPAMLFHAAEAAFQQGEFEAAYKRYSELAQRFPEHELSERSLYHAAEAARRLGNPDGVFASARELYTRFPESQLTDRMALSVGQTLLGLKRTDEAANYLEQLLRHRPDPAVARAARYYRAAALRQGGKIDEALEVLRPLLEGEAKDVVTADAFFFAGSCHFQRKQYERAVPLLQKYLARQPNGDAAGHASAYLCVSLASLGNFDELPPTVEQLRDKASGDLALPALYQAAEACYDAGRYALAQELYVQIVQQDTKGTLHAKALAGLGWSGYQQGNYSEAAEAFGRLVGQHVGDALASEAAYMRGRSLEAASRRTDAISAYRKTLETYPQSPEAFEAGLQLARLLRKIGKTREAAEAYQSLAQQFSENPKLDSALNEWAWACLATGEEDQAQEILQQLLDQFPGSPLVPEATVNLCETLFQAKRFSEVIELLEPLLKGSLADGIREAALYRVGRTQIELGRWAESKATFEQLVTKFPESPLRREGEFWMAEADRELDQVEAAAALLARLVAEPSASEPWLALAWLRLAQCQGQLKQWKKVLTTTNEIRKRFPQFERMSVVDYHTGRALQSRAKFDEAREAYQQAIAGRSDENAARSQFMIAETYFHQKRYRDALREFLKVEILYAFSQWQASALLEAAKCHEMLQEWSRAAETYNRILDIYPNSSHVARARRRLDAVRRKITAAN